jgi:hypothetical protein
VSRDDDIRMLEEVLEFRSLPDDTEKAFLDMLDKLRSDRHDLTDRQRAWVKSVLGEPDYQNLVSSGVVSNVVKHWHPESAPCTSTCPAWRPPALATLPKKPPTRRTA